MSFAAGPFFECRQAEQNLHVTVSDGLATTSQTREHGGFLYIDIGDGNVYLVREDPMDYVDSSLSSMIAHDDTPGFETVVDITFAGSENYTITRIDESAHTYDPEEDVYFVERNGETVPLDTASVRQYLNTVTALDLLDYVTYNATGEELAAYGLEEPALSVTVNYTYTDDNDETVAEGGAGSTVTKYVRIGDSRIIYTVDSVDHEGDSDVRTWLAADPA